MDKIIHIIHISFNKKQRQFLSKYNSIDNESNDKTTAGPLCRHLGTHPEQMVPSLQERAGGTRHDKPHEAPAATHRRLDMQQVLHRCGLTI